MPESGNLFYFYHKTQALGDLPIVFIHGAGGTHMHWPPHIRRLAGCRIYAPDLAAHGKSHGTPRTSFDEHAQDLIQFATSLEIPSAVWIGHSMGSAIALQIALLHPERVKALVLIGGGAKLRVHPEILSSAGDPNLFEKAVGLMIEESYGNKADPNLRKIGHQQMLENRSSVFYGDLLACENFDVRDQLIKIQQPTLILCGRDDRMTPVKYSEYLHVNLSNSILHVHQDAGHMIMLEQPAWVKMEIEDFLQSLKNLGTPPIQE